MQYLLYGSSRRSTDWTLAQRIPSHWDLRFWKQSSRLGLRVLRVLWPCSLSTVRFWVYRKPYRVRSKPSTVIVLSIITQALLTGRVSCLKSEMGKSPGEVNNHVPPEAAPPPPLYAHHALAHTRTQRMGETETASFPFSHLLIPPQPLLPEILVFQVVLNQSLIVPRFFTSLCSLCTSISVCFSDALVLFSPSMVVVINSLWGLWRGAGSCYESSIYHLSHILFKTLHDQKCVDTPNKLGYFS